MDLASILAILSVFAGVISLILLFHRRWKLGLLDRIEKSGDSIIAAALALHSLLDEGRYISKTYYRTWLNEWKHISPLVKEWSRRGRLKTSVSEVLGNLFDAFERGEALIKTRNDRYIQREIEKHKTFFDSDRSIIHSDKALSYAIKEAPIL